MALRTRFRMWPGSFLISFQAAGVTYTLYSFTRFGPWSCPARFCNGFLFQSFHRLFPVVAADRSDYHDPAEIARVGPEGSIASAHQETSFVPHHRHRQLAAAGVAFGFDGRLSRRPIAA